MNTSLKKLFNVDKVTFFVSTAFAILAVLAVYATSQVRAVQVSALPEGNLVLNPWFRSTAKPTVSALDYWTDSSPAGLLWSTSQKGTNPTPNVIVSGKCGGSSEQYCGTSARFASGRGQGGGGAGQSGVDAYLYQVVAADPELTTLKFLTHWVTGEIVEANVTIYGSETGSGAWVPVWVPLHVTPANGSGYAWTQTELLETTIETGYPYYKIELHGKYPSGTSQGVKYTGVYFAVADSSGNVATATPTQEPVATSTVTPTLSPTPGGATSTPTPILTSTPTPTNIPSNTSTPTPTQVPNQGNNNAPVLRTNFLSSGSVGQAYSYSLQGYDNDKDDTLTMTATGLPSELSITNCTKSIVGSQARYYCTLSGTPSESGAFQPTITLSDQFGASASKTFNLSIN